MVISRNFLSEFFPGIKDLTIEQISDAFFKSGIDIESWEKIQPPSGLYYGIVNDVNIDSRSSKLKICQVFIPVKNETFQIVCGADNVREGMKVVVALPGASLLNGTFLISERIFKSIGDVKSHGMICAYSEMYKSDILKNISNFDKGKIIELGDEWNINKEFEDSDFWFDDWIFDLSIPANRSDLYSAWGLSRELAKLLSIPSKELFHGGIYKEFQDSWILKRILLVNNCPKIGNFYENLDFYAYLAFNEYISDSNNGVRKKSDYFKKLLNSWMQEQPLTTFSTKKIFANMDEIFKRIGLDNNFSYVGDFFKLEEDGALVPEWRNDICSDRDILDEILSLVGWDKIIDAPVIGSIERKNNNEMILAIEKIREFWKNHGFYECNTFNLHEEKEGEICVNNPLSNLHVSLRSHAIHELINVISKNYNEKKSIYPVFEIFEKQSEKKEWILNVIVPENKSWFPLNDTRLKFDLYDLQSLIRRSFNYLNQTINFLQSKENNFPFLEINCMNISNLGVMGYLDSPIDVKMWGFYCTIPQPKDFVRLIQTPSKFPPSYKDISLEISNSEIIPVSKILNSFKSKHLVSVQLVEKYKSSEFLSYLFRIKLQSMDHTLTREEINSNMNELYDSLVNFPGIKIR